MATASGRFVGWIIGNAREEFLASVSGDPEYIAGVSWARLPGLAQVFPNRRQAEEIVATWRRADQAWCICGLWDQGETWMVDWDWDNEAAQAAD
jgi:hypothetical protein